MEPAFKTNYVLIDYENVQPGDIRLLNQDNFRVIVFLGANQSKVTVEVASTLQSMGTRGEYIKITGNGKNALDFHVAFYIGQIAAIDRDARFHIISKDSGFDPLIEHLKSKRIHSRRSSCIAEIPHLKAASTTSPDEKLTLIVTDLQRRGSSKPRTAKTLAGTINSLFQKKLSDGELSSLLGELKQQGMIAIDGAKVTYTLPS